MNQQQALRTRIAKQYKFSLLTERFDELSKKCASRICMAFGVGIHSLPAAPVPRVSGHVESMWYGGVRHC